MTDVYELARQAEQNPAQVDFLAMRQAYVQSDAYQPIKHISQSKLMQITDSVQDFGEVVTTCKNILLTNPLDLEARMALAMAYEKVGDAINAERQHAFAEAMLDAILSTGDGKSFEKAFKLVAANEAWTVMRSFGIRVTSQEQHQKDGRVYDVFTGKLGDNVVSVYFDVTDHARFLDNTLEDQADDS